MVRPLPADGEIAFGDDGRLVWVICGGVTIAAHVLLALWLLPSNRPLEPPAPPPAILIDLTQPAEEPAAASPTVAPEPAKPEPEPAKPEPPAPEPPKPEPAKAEPPPEPQPAPPPEPVPESPVPPVVTPMAAPEVVLPPPVVTAPDLPAPPKPREKPRPPERRRPEPPQEVKRAPPAPAPAPAPAVQAAVEPAPVPAPLAAAPAPASAASSAAALAAMKAWQGEVLAQLARNQHYPLEARSNREQGTAFLHFAVDRDGRVTAFSLEKSSGFSSLDAETLALIQRAQPLPPPPPEIGQSRIELIVPIDFHLRN